MWVKRGSWLIKMKGLSEGKAPAASGIERIVAKIEKCNKLGIAARMKNDLEDAWKLYGKAVNTAITNRDILTEAGVNVKLFLSDYYTNIGDLKRIEGSEASIAESEAYFSQAIRCAGDDKQRKAKALEFRCILSQQHTYDYSMAISDSKDALDLYLALGNRQKIARLRCLYAESLSLKEPAEKFNKAVVLCRLAIESYKLMGKKMPEHDLGDAYHTLGRIYSRNGISEMAYSHFEEALKHLRKAKSAGAIGVVNARIAYEAMRDDRRELAEKHLKTFEGIKNKKVCPIQPIVLKAIEPQAEEVRRYLTSN